MNDRMTTFQRCVLALALLAPVGGHAQEASVGLAFGPGFVGPANNKTISSTPFPVSGADRGGPHARAYVEMRWDAPISLRTELFYNRFVSKPNTISGCCGGVSQAALRDGIGRPDLHAARLESARVERRRF
jgi:hypothetical protein